MSKRRRATAPGLAALVVTLLTLCLSLAGAAEAQEACAAPAEGDPVIGLALGGGGARGFAHVGVLKYLEEHRIPYHRIAGTSMGSIAGGFAAAGMTAEDITRLVEQTDWVDIFSDDTDRQDMPFRRKQDDFIGLYGPKFGIGEGDAVLPYGVVSGQKILFLFESVADLRTQTHDFDALPVPYRAIATDLVTGDLVVLDGMPLALAMRASMSVPGVFDPVHMRGRLLVDGGLVRNLPVDIVRDMGAEVVIAVDVGTPLRKAEDIGNVLSIMDQMTGLAIVANTRIQLESLGDGDVLIRPPLGNDITSSSFDSFSDAFTLGYAAAQEMAEQLAPYALSKAEYARWRKRLAQCVSGEPTLHFVELDNRSRFSDAVIEELIHFEPGQPLDPEQLEADLRQVYGLGFIRVASYSIVEQDGRQGLKILVLQDDRGTDFIESGLTIAASGRGAFINLQGGYLKTDLDDRGSEFRAVLQAGDDFGLVTDVFKYLDDRREWSINPYLLASRRNLLIFVEGDALSEARVEEIGGGVRVGREFGRHAYVALGARSFTGEAQTVVGVPNPGVDFDGGEFSLTAIWDRLDNLYLPTRGARARLDYIRSADVLGSDDDYEQLLFDVVTSKTWGLHNVLFTGRYNTTLDGVTPIYAIFTGGGFLNMSGFEPNQFVGQHFGVLGLGYRYQVLDSGILPGYVGGTVEYGNSSFGRSSDVFDEGILNGSVYFAYDTPLGPLYAGWGWNEDSRGLFFLRLGAVIGSETLGRR